MIQRAKALQKRTGADAAESFLIQAGADEEEGYGKADLAQVIENTKSWMECRRSSVQQRGKTEEQDEPGPLNTGFALQGDGGDQRQRNDPEGPRQFDGGPDGERGGAVFGGGADDGTGVVNGESRPETELRLRHVKRVSNQRKEKQCNRVKDEDSAQRDGHLFFAGFGNRANSGNGAASANGGAGADEECGLFSDMQKIAEVRGPAASPW